MTVRLLQSVAALTAFALVAALATSYLGIVDLSATAQEKPADKPKAELRHVVLVKFKADTTKEQVAEVVQAFGELPKKIDAIAGFEWGTDVSPEMLSAGFTHCFLVTFRDAQARDEYLPHAAHEDFKKLAIPRVEKVLVVDFVNGQ